jgi:6-pyruvoyltetrahydropterin/6-carboxytetrahydropterin synthase
MTAIFLEDSFDSAHYLPNVQPTHKCHELHGHTYRIRIEITGEVGERTGWIMDYQTARNVWQHNVKQVLDHRLLNEIEGLQNPTCELIAAWIAERLDFAGLVRIELRETEHCGVVYIP